MFLSSFICNFWHKRCRFLEKDSRILLDTNRQKIQIYKNVSRFMKIVQCAIIQESINIFEEKWYKFSLSKIGWSLYFIWPYRMFHKIIFMFLIAATIQKLLARSQSLSEEPKLSNNVRNFSILKNVYIHNLIRAKY